ncbi:hypothetical protein HNR46_002819 [Haloferula luteola]|uniref:Uncharacterized protein n=1 Tax=Haloferula luteola TaxID=595692 RepID=A0A840V4S5_9BACT|nr:hypothetical protein [Haloferula luteola]MBB5352573.1 hypothetical protein [Haloferula luteola]
MPLSESIREYRSLPHKRSFVLAMAITSFQFLCLVATGTLASLMIIHDDRSLGIPLVIVMALQAAIWLSGLLVRKGARCPLCKGTPLLDNTATKNARAQRIFPFNYGTTALISLLFTQRFRCMYCGSPFDLIKRSRSDYGRE